MDVVIATNNKHKVLEFQQILSKYNIKCYSLSDLNINVDPEETGKTFAENSLIKANAVKEFTDKVIIADDSGFLIDALPEILGVHSHRFFGEDTTYYQKNQELIRLMKDIPNKNASFVCTITVLNLEDKPLQFTGICYGKVSDEIKGTNGFGYDPVFIPNGYDKTMAELGEDIKCKIAHRAKACDQLIEYLDRKIG